MQFSSFQNDILLQTFLLQSKSNNHIICDCSLIINDDVLDEVCSKVGEECEITGEETDSYKGAEKDFKFKGIVKSISSHEIVEGTFVDVHIEGLSIKYDFEEKECLKRRVFQNEKKTLSDILEKMELSDIAVSIEGEEEKISDIIVQDDETDWYFLLRLSKILGYRVFANLQDKTVKIGQFSNNSKKEIKEEDIADIKKFYLSKNDKKTKKIECRLNTLLQLGETVSLDGEEFVVDSFILEKVSETFHKKYVLVQYDDEKIKNKSDYILKAKVKDNKDEKKLGRVQVEFDVKDENDENETEDSPKPFEDKMKDEATWIETSTFFATNDNDESTGISFIPKKDDLVFVRIKNGKALIESSIRTKEFRNGNDEDYNPDTKYLFLNNERFIEFNDKESIFKTKKYICTLDEEKCEIVWNEKINIKIEDGRIFVSNNDKSKSEITEEHLQFETDNSKFEIAKKITATSYNAFAVDGGSKIDMKASKIDINGSGGVSIN